MPKSIVDIEVNSQSFKDFQALFQKYSDELAKMPDAWKNVDASVKSVTDAFTKHAASGSGDAFAEGAVAAAAMADALAAADISTQSTTRGFAALAKHSKSIAGSIFGATRDLAKWAALSVGAGLLGGGGLLYGLDRLADSVGGQRRAAQGLGITTGEQRAFGTTLGRLVDPSMIQSVSDVRADLSQQWKLGLSASQVNGDDNAQLSVDELKRARQLWKQLGAGGHNTQTMQAYGLDSFMSFDDWRRIGNTSDSEFSSDVKQYGAATKALSVDDPTNKAWQDLSVQLNLAGQEIETVFITGLKPLVGPLTDLSKAFTADFKALLNNPSLKSGIDEFAKWMGSFATYLGSDQFGKDMKTFADDVGGVASGLLNALKWLKLIPSPGGGGDPLQQLQQNTFAQMQKQLRIDHQGGFAGAAFYAANDDVLYHGFNPITALTTPGIAKGYDFRKVSAQFGLPASLLPAIGMQESGLNAHPADSVVNGVHYQGMFQMGLAAQRQYGVYDPYNPAQEAYGAGAMLSDLAAKYKGNLAEAIAAYDGDTHVDADYAKYGRGGWIGHAKPETQKYLAATAARMGITVNIMNQTGANVAVLTNAAGAQ